MHIFFETYLERMEALHRDIERAIADLPQAGLDWIPGEDIPSICVLVTHLTGAERFWIGDIGGQDPSGRDREAEFKVRGVGLSELQRRLHASRLYAHKLFETIELQDIEDTRISPRNGEQITVSWALLHALEHSAIHLGHIQLIRQLWDQHQDRLEDDRR
jgi:uncharacterized damage-inducible protein DinB